jgi:oxygen-independent coproporphyrinogen-3 oxidase
MEDGVLAAMGRGHRGADVPRAVESARKAGMENVSLDLIYGYPGQTQEGWERTLCGVLELGVPHLSCYALTVEEGTPLYDQAAAGQVLLDEESQADRGDLAVSLLDKAGYRRYEISNFAKPGFESRHNTVYWERKPYVGIGAGAHGYLWGKGGWFRYFHANDLGAYRKELEAAPGERFPNREYLSRAQRMFEAVMLSTRMARGLDRAAFHKEFGIRVEDAYPGVIQPLLDGNLLMERGEYFALTPRGMDLQNGILMGFMGDL